MSTEHLAYTGPFGGPSHPRQAYDSRGAPLDGDRIVLSWGHTTEHKPTELELHMQSVVLDLAGEGVCLIRASDTVIVYANPRFAQIFGYAPGELEGQRISILNWEEHPGDAERSAREIVEVLERRGEASFEVRNRCKNGTRSGPRHK